MLNSWTLFLYDISIPSQVNNVLDAAVNNNHIDVVKALIGAGVNMNPPQHEEVTDEWNSRFVYFYELFIAGRDVLRAIYLLISDQ